MLRLAAPTRDDWLDEARARPDLLLLDHAHCEKKAASTAVNLIFRYTERPSLMVPLSELAREELEHFEQVLGVLESRGIAYQRLQPSAYAGKLMKVVRSEEPERLLDTLLGCACIEARSCERMQILAEGLDDPELRALYGSLLVSEARHHSLYVELARGIFPEGEVRERLKVVADHEAAVLAKPGPEVRMHS